MQGRQDRNGKGRLFGAVGLSLLVLLVGCERNSLGVSDKARPGAERATTPSNSLPSASAGRQYDVAVAPVDETRNSPQIGSQVAESGGQKAQKEKEQKAQAEADAKARTEREKVEAE